MSIVPFLEKIKQMFPANSPVFVLDPHFYGSYGTVLYPENDEIFVEFIHKRHLGFNPDKYLATLKEDVYMPLMDAVEVGRMSPLTFSKITGAVYLYDDSGQHYNIGLNLVSNKMKMERPGYTKTSGLSWLYSLKTIELVQRYKNRFPELFNVIDSVGARTYRLINIYPVAGMAKVREIRSWLGKQDHNAISSVVCGTELLPPKVVAALEKDLKKVHIVEKKITARFPPHKLYRVSQNMLNPPPAAQQFCLLDRVITCCVYPNVPLGAYGYIIGIFGGRDPTKPLHFHVLFDNILPCGLSLQGSSPKRALLLSENFVINISDFIRKYFHFSTADLLPPANQNEQLLAAAASNMRNNQASYVAQLHLHWKQIGKQVPLYKVGTSVNGLLVANVILPNNQVYHGFPCKTWEAASESAAYMACVSIGLAQRESDKKESTLFPQATHQYNTPGRTDDQVRIATAVPGPSWWNHQNPHVLHYQYLPSNFNLMPPTNSAKCATFPMNHPPLYPTPKRESTFCYPAIWGQQKYPPTYGMNQVSFQQVFGNNFYQPRGPLE